MTYYLYRMYDKDRNLLYIGSTGDWQRRFVEHSKEKHENWSDVAYTELTHYTDKKQGLYDETSAIMCENPPWNRAYCGRDKPAVKRDREAERQEYWRKVRTGEIEAPLDWKGGK